MTNTKTKTTPIKPRSNWTQVIYIGVRRTEGGFFHAQVADADGKVLETNILTTATNERAALLEARRLIESKGWIAQGRWSDRVSPTDTTRVRTFVRRQAVKS